MIFIIIILYGFLFFDFKGSLENTKCKYEFEFNGVVWYLLDLYSIKKYHRNDHPIKIISFKNYKNGN
jgi:hypothetical protein